MNSVFSRRMWIVVAAILHLCLADLSGAADKKPGEANVALVNGKPITRAELDRETTVVLRNLANRGETPNDERTGEIRKNVLEGLIGSELLAQEAKKKGIKVDQAAVTGRFDAIKARFPNKEEFRSALAKGDHTEASIKAVIEKGLLIQEFINKEFVEKTIVTPEESKAFYSSNPESFKQEEQVRASHILILVDEKAGPDQKAKARWEMEEIKKKLEKGGDFAALAKEFSQCPSKARGGDLGFFVRGQMVKPFEDVAFSLKPGETSGIVETQFGFHIIKVVEKKPEKSVPYEEARERLEKHLKDQKVRAELDRRIAELKANAKVERMTPETKK